MKHWKPKVMTSGLITSWQIEGGKVEAVTDFIFLGSRITADIDYSVKWKDTPWKESYDKPRQLIKKQRHHFAHKGPYSQNHTYGFPHSYLQMWALDHKEGWAPKNWCFQVVVLEKTLGSPLDSKEIKKIYPKGNQPWIFIGRTDAETPILWPPAVKSQLIGKDPDAGKDWRRKEKRVAEDEMVFSITDSMVMNLSKLWEIAKDRATCCCC